MLFKNVKVKTYKLKFCMWNLILDIKVGTQTEGVEFEVSTAVTMKIAIFWDVMPCRSCKNHFIGKQHLHHQGDKNWWARNNISSN
jgi:hypothetical protein